jgi:hypothetical protein
VPQAILVWNSRRLSRSSPPKVRRENYNRDLATNFAPILRCVAPNLGSAAPVKNTATVQIQFLRMYPVVVDSLAMESAPIRRCVAPNTGIAAREPTTATARIHYRTQPPVVVELLAMEFALIPLFVVPSTDGAERQPNTATAPTLSLKT